MVPSIIKGRDLKKLVVGLDDNADVIITLNGDPDSTLLVYLAKKDAEGELK